MEIITHREMRNRSAEVLRRVEAGESLQVSNNGRPAALIVPVPHDAVAAAIIDGGARPARAGLETLRSIPRVRSATGTAQIIEDARGRW